MTAPAIPAIPAKPVARPAALTANLPGTSGVAGARGFVAPDGTRIVIVLDQHDTTSDGAPEHIGIGCTAWEVDAAGNIVGEPLPRRVHTAPVGVIAAGDATLADIIALQEDGAVTRLLERKSVLAEMAALGLAAQPPMIKGNP